MSGVTDPGDDASPREVDFVETDALLRDDVRRLGAMVGEMLAEQGSPDLLEQVESIRRMAIERRESGAAIDTLAQRLAAVAPQRADALVRAFAAYFGATNLAERVHRIRRRRDYQRAGSAPQPGGLEAVLGELRDAGVRYEDLDALLPRLSIEPVFTAHPTEAVRRALLVKEREIVERLVADIDRERTPSERRSDLERIRLALTSAWQTSESPPTRPTVADEREHVGFYLADVLYRVVPVFYEVFADAVAAVYGEQVELPTVLHFGTWVGGDMDGNPNVGADTIAAALDAQRSRIIANYRRDVRGLASILTQTRDRVGIDEAIDERIAQSQVGLPETPPSNPRHADMPYVQLLERMEGRLRASVAAVGDGQVMQRVGRAGYVNVEAFIDDLAAIDASLAHHRGEHAGRFALRRVMRRARTFGFHLAALDVRQDSALHDEALAGLLDDAAWATAPVDERVARLHALIAGEAPARPRPRSKRSTCSVPCSMRAAATAPARSACTSSA
jgi:phosphoenolpyruvate carboxylase